jgi:hypothetical protein
MFVSGYDDRESQALHLLEHHSGHFFSPGERGPQPIWLFDHPLEASSFLWFLADRLRRQPASP